MENQKRVTAVDARGTGANEDRQQAREPHHDPETLPDDYAQWLDSWMFSPDDDAQQQQQDEG